MPNKISPGAGEQEGRDGCAIIAFVDKRGRATHANLQQAIDALRKMGHRSGDIDGEGDGCGIQTDIPRRIWARRLAAQGLNAHLAESTGFFVAHCYVVQNPGLNGIEAVMAQARKLFQAHDCEILLELSDGARPEELGPRARESAPLFWQLAGIATAADRAAGRQKLFKLQLALEKRLPALHLGSLSLDSVVFKMQGLPCQLARVFPELRDPEMRSAITIGHGRYSTNTLPTVERTQPFSMLVHNGEINTIDRLRDCGRALGIEPVPGGSDSQDLNRLLEGLVNLHDLELLQAMELAFPAIDSEVEKYPPELQEMYAFLRWAFPCSAQGPAAVLARVDELCLGSVDALGLRPLWFGESDHGYFLSSEKGVVDLELQQRDPRPLAPGEKIAILCHRGREAEILDAAGIQRRLLQLFGRLHRGRFYLLEPPALLSPVTTMAAGEDGDAGHGAALQARAAGPLSVNLLAAFGWQAYDHWIRAEVSRHGREVIGSMGYTGPLAALVPEALPNLADFCKENVAVVTNPALDREREAEHFSTRLVLGSRPALGEAAAKPPLAISLGTPLILPGQILARLLSTEQLSQLCARFSTTSLEEIITLLSGGHRDPELVRILDATFKPAQGLEEALRELIGQALQAVHVGAVLLVLDDSGSFSRERVYIDPALALARVSEALLAAGLRRQTGIVVQSGAIRNLHDIMFLLGLGADALCPYLLWRVAADQGGDGAAAALDHTFTVLQKGMEKVMSTMGSHELCGYGRSFTALGLQPELAALLGLTTFCGSAAAGHGLAALEQMAAQRLRLAVNPEAAALYREPDRNPKIGRILRNAALGGIDFRQMAGQLAQVAEELPTAIRHLLRSKATKPEKPLTMDQVDISIGEHAMPLVIAAMSFGSQGETSFRAYAEAAARLNIVCLNGEGGEIPDLLGRYRRNRGQQIASGRFGVFMGQLNAADFLEIKIGQGAKPGEGGHLPGSKVTEMVARARRCKAGITLISPSNHHDIYSIEDLAQIITELKTANPQARISVKIPVSGGIGTIAVGIAKAGAGIINISGYDGGTGAAREHAKKFVGLPAEIGVSEAHRALVETGLRQRVEIWTDGGLRSGDDVLKMILLGANRVGFGTVALMGIGCISCRRCHLDRCPRGITTQLRSRTEAEARGIKGFLPRVLDDETNNLVRLFTAIGDELRLRLVELGEPRLSELVGRTELLEQYRLPARLAASQLLKPPAFVPLPPPALEAQSLRKPLNYLTRLIADLAMARFEAGAKLVNYSEEGVRSTDRAVGTYLAGAMARAAEGGDGRQAVLRLGSSVPGNGLGAFMAQGLEVVVEGGCQDGAAKGAVGGLLAVLRGRNLAGRRIDGSTGKSFAYGASGGLLMVQNLADSRAGVRLSGAEVVFGGRITAPVQDQLGNIAVRAHLKGFAFEYMTGGCVVVLGDPGPWICAGMTGGVIYQCLYEEFGFDRQALKRRLARAAQVAVRPISPAGQAEVGRLLARYIVELEHSFQPEEAAAVTKILGQAGERFVTITPQALRPHSAE